MMKPECDFLNQDPKRPKAQTKTLPNRAAKNGGQDRWCFCASATASAAPRASPPSSPWRRPSNLVKPCRAPVLRVCPSSETPAPFLLHLLPFPPPPFLCALTFFSALSSSPLRVGAQEVQGDGHRRRGGGGGSSSRQGLPRYEGGVRQARRVPQRPGTAPVDVLLLRFFSSVMRSKSRGYCISYRFVGWFGKLATRV
jgi:hypothetical protein